MRQNMPDVNFPTVVVDGRNEPGFVAANVENGELSHLIRVRKDHTHFLNIGKAGPAHFLKPLHKTGRTIRVQFGEFIQPFASDDVHGRPTLPDVRRSLGSEAVAGKQQRAARTSCQISDTD